MMWACLTAPTSAAATPQLRRHSLRSYAKLPHIRDDRVVMTDPRTGNHFMPGETSRARTVYTAVALFCAVLLAFLLGMHPPPNIHYRESNVLLLTRTNGHIGLRVKTLAKNVRKRNNLTSIVLSFLFVFAILFIFATAAVESGQSLASYNLCYSAIIICLVFYTTNKLAMLVQPLIPPSPQH